MTNNNLIKRVVDDGYCSGCGICAGAIAPSKIEIARNENGFLRPLVSQPLSRAEADRFQSVCPGINLSHPATTESRDPIWGACVSLRVGHSTDEEIRRRGSSGGAISAMLVHLLDTKAVDYVIHSWGASPLENKPRISRTRDDVLSAVGSRYSPSAPLQSLEECLSLPGTCAFVGKPCDVAALRNLTRIDSRVRDKVRYMLSFFCAGIPSIHATYALFDHLGVEASQVVKLDYRGNGWPGKTTVVLKDGGVRETDYNTSWGTILNRHLQFRCKICPDGVGEFADVSCADAWYSDDGYPSFTEQAGRSLILTRTAAGEQLVQDCLRQRSLEAEPLAISEIAKMQPYQLTRKATLVARLAGIVFRFRRIPKYRGMGIWRAVFRANLRLLVRTAVGTFVRAGRRSDR